MLLNDCCHSVSGILRWVAVNLVVIIGASPVKVLMTLLYFSVERRSQKSVIFSAGNHHFGVLLKCQNIQLFVFTVQPPATAATLSGINGVDR